MSRSESPIALFIVVRWRRDEGSGDRAPRRGRNCPIALLLLSSTLRHPVRAAALPSRHWRWERLVWIAHPADTAILRPTPQISWDVLVRPLLIVARRS